MFATLTIIRSFIISKDFPLFCRFFHPGARTTLLWNQSDQSTRNKLINRGFPPARFRSQIVLAEVLCFHQKIEKDDKSGLDLREFSLFLYYVEAHSERGTWQSQEQRNHTRKPVMIFSLEMENQKIMPQMKIPAFWSHQIKKVHSWRQTHFYSRTCSIINLITSHIQKAHFPDLFHHIIAYLIFSNWARDIRAFVFPRENFIHNQPFHETYLSTIHNHTVWQTQMSNRLLSRQIRRRPTFDLVLFSIEDTAQIR